MRLPRLEFLLHLYFYSNNNGCMRQLAVTTISRRRQLNPVEQRPRSVQQRLHGGCRSRISECVSGRRCDESCLSHSDSIGDNVSSAAAAAAPLIAGHAYSMCAGGRVLTTHGACDTSQRRVPTPHPATHRKAASDRHRCRIRGKEATPDQYSAARATVRRSDRPSSVNQQPEDHFMRLCSAR